MAMQFENYICLNFY